MIEKVYRNVHDAKNAYAEVYKSLSRSEVATAFKKREAMVPWDASR